MIKEYIPKIKKTIRKLIYVLIIEVFIFVGFVGYEFLIWRKNINLLNSKSQELQNKSEKFVMLNSMSKESEKIKTYLEENQNRIFKREEAEKFISTLPLTMLDFGLKNINISISEEKRILEKKDYFNIDLYLTFDGDLGSFYKFLDYLENLNKFININDFSFTQTKDGLNFELSISIPLF
ncbi:MAG: type 4a pilus biogenesis protein PilO [Caldisericia bacterium]|jgi:Tfp pilus assembly protein PilO|nr:type 4a pilus biogenesis protein PilO [Caldisericia bacterium]